MFAIEIFLWYVCLVILSFLDHLRLAEHFPLTDHFQLIDHLASFYYILIIFQILENSKPPARAGFQGAFHSN